MALTFPPLRVESPLSQLHQVGIQILTSPSPHSAFGESSKIGLLSDPRRQELGDCSDGEYWSDGGYRRIYLAILCRIGLLSSESGCTQFIFGNRISPRTTLHFSDPYTHKNATKANETCQNNSLQTTQNIIVYFNFCQNR